MEDRKGKSGGRKKVGRKRNGKKYEVRTDCEEKEGS